MENGVFKTSLGVYIPHKKLLIGLKARVRITSYRANQTGGKMNSFIAHIDSIDLTHRMIVVNGNLYGVSEKINLQYYKAGDSVEMKLGQDGRIVFIKKQTSGIPAQPQPVTQQFVPASVPAPAPKPKQDSTGNAMLWCNSVNSAIEILKVRVRDSTPSELGELDLISITLEYARLLYKEAIDNGCNSRNY